MTDQGGNNIVMRDYRKGNWTVSETMVLIEAKKMDDERRMMMKRSTSGVVVGGGGGGGGEHSSEGRPSSSSKPAELRWKWVEDYCWRKGCLRSQNQCNDKWDNLMRDFKKIREHERRITERRGELEGSANNNDRLVTYWDMEKNERKDKNLPSNMMPQIYEALVEVVERKSAAAGHHQRLVSSGGSAPTTPTNIGGYVVERPLMMTTSVQAPLPPLLPHQVSPVTIPAVLPLPPPPPPPPPPPVLQCSQQLPIMCDSSDSDTSEYSDSPAKRRRKGGGGGGNGNGNGGEGTSHGTATATATTASTSSSSHEVGSAISKSASIIADAIQACEEREERRHRDLIGLHERRLKIEESKTEVSRQGINGLVDAINKLANSILALASNHNKNQSSSAPE